MSRKDNLESYVQVNHDVPKWMREMVKLLADSQGISVEKWWMDACSLKLSSDFEDVEGVFNLASNFVRDYRERSEVTRRANPEQR